MGATYKHIELVGRLAREDEVLRDPVFINKSGDIQYKVKALTKNDEVPSDFFTGYMDSIRNKEFVDDQYASSKERVTAFQEFYADKLFVFSYKIDAMGNSKIDVADILPCPTKINPNTRFIAVPCFSSQQECNEVNNVILYRTAKNILEFSQCLLEGKAIGKVYNYQISSLDSFPEFVIWNDPEIIRAIGLTKSVSRSAMDSFILHVNPEEYREIDLDDEEDDTLEYLIQSDYNPTLFHIPEKKYVELLDRLASPSAEGTAQVPSSSTIQTAPISDSKNVEKEELSHPSVDVDVANTPPVVIEQPKEDLRELPTEKTEAAILEYFRYHSQRSKLFYNPKDIANFHTAIKTGSLVILSGMSGTGKSALVDTYAKALGVGKNVLMIPVRPSWNDDSDLLGYVDLIHMVYRPSDTGFIDKIVEAAKEENKDKLYFICLDEMNLARVEHYFSQFLSIMEKPSGARELVLYDEQYASRLYNSARYPQRITIGDNIRFIGTVNIDESTYHFSDKVLDRANVITLDILDYSNPTNWREDKYRPPISLEWTHEEFKKLVKKDETTIENQTRIREFLWKMHTLLHGVNGNLGVGPRIVKSIEIYLKNLPDCSEEFFLSAREGLDYQVAQRILTKIRGPEEQLKCLFSYEPGKRSVLLETLYEFSDISSFDRCKNAIEQKEKELRVYGYCL